MKILRLPVFFSLLCLFFLCGCILPPVQGKDKLTAATVAKAPATTREEGRRRLKLLVEKFSRDPRALKMTEAELRRVYLDEFLRCLGWDVGNSQRKGLYEQDSIPEARLFMSNTLRFVDYKQRIDDKCFMIEAKRAGFNIDKPAYRFQAKRYCYSSLRAELTWLTNFKELRVFVVRQKPVFSQPGTGEIKIFSFSFKKYLENFDLLYDVFSKESVATGSLKRMLDKNNPGLSRVTVDQTLIKEDEFSPAGAGEGHTQKQPWHYR